MENFYEDKFSERLSNEKHEFLIDPEPFTILLGVLGFLGSVASIAGYIEFKKKEIQQAHESRLKLLREAKDLIMSLEVDTMQIEMSLQKLEFILEEGTGNYHTIPLSKLKFQFGTCKPVFTLLGFNKFDEVSQELNRLIGRSFETVSKLLQRFYNLDIEFEKDVYEKLIELQGKLNAILRKDTTYQEGFRAYYEMIVFTKELLRRMRERINKETSQ